jgi:AcrR family transcriptional regulator
MLAMSATEVTPVVPGSATWWLERQARAARRRPRADGLSTERIIAAALHLVDTEGLDALTVRRLADDLATGSASLYRHVASRDELLVLLVDHVIGEVEHPPPGVQGRAKAVALATGLRNVLMAHANLVPALTASPLLGPNSLRGTENAVAGMIEAGFEPAVAVPAYLALIDYVLGTVFFDTSSAGRASGVTHSSGDLIAELPAEMFPTLVTHRDEFTRSSIDDVFVLGLTAFLDGLERRYRPRP